MQPLWSVPKSSHNCTKTPARVSNSSSSLKSFETMVLVEPDFQTWQVVSYSGDDDIHSTISSSSSISSHHTWFDQSSKKTGNSKANCTQTSLAGQRSSWKKTFGERKDGSPCLLCLRQQKFCHLHKDQEKKRESKKNEARCVSSSASTSTNSQRSSATKSSKKTPTTKNVENRNIVSSSSRLSHHHLPSVTQDYNWVADSPSIVTSSSRSSRHQGTTSRKKKIFGIRKDGEPCRRCLNQEKFCYQHIDQEKKLTLAEDKSEKDSKRASRHSMSSRKQNAFDSPDKQELLGLNRGGTECRLCLSAGKFCHMHKWQADGDKSLSFGVCRDGTDCRRCIAQEKYCYQHKYQEEEHYGGKGETKHIPPTYDIVCGVCHGEDPSTCPRCIRKNGASI